ncbi:MAG: hypothetical protein HWE26_10915 [Alteromonadaceae bacterium]|nr:hypothetical protein [Alteromonadaceae bacterium]
MSIIYSPSAVSTKEYPSYKLLDGGFALAFSSPENLRESAVQGLGAGTIWQAGTIAYTEAALNEAAAVTTAGGVRLNINLNRYELKAEAFGVKFTGDDADASENAQLLQGALDWLESEGQGGRIALASGGHMKIDHAIQCRNGIIIDGRGCLTDNILDRNVTPSSRFTQDCCYLTGAFARYDDNDHTFHALQPVELGASEVVLKTAATAAAYAVGDIIWIAQARDAFGSGGVFPDKSELARIIDISGAILKLEHPLGIDIDQAGAGTIGNSPSGAWVANVDYRMAADKTGGDMIGGRHVCRDITLVDHRLRQSGASGDVNNAPLAVRSGMYNGHVENIEVDGMVSNLLFGNGYVHSLFKNVRGPYIRRAIEIKCLSHDSRFEDISAWKMPHGYALDTDEHVPISVGENSRRIEVVRPRVDTGHWHNPETVIGSNLIAFSAAEDCSIVDPRVTGTGLFSSVVAFPEASVRCRVSGGTLLPPSNVSIENSGIDNEVIDTVFGEASTYAYRHNDTAEAGRIKGCRWQQENAVRLLATTRTSERPLQLIDNIGLLNISNAPLRPLIAKDNSNLSTQVLAQALGVQEDLTGYATSATSETGMGDVTVVPAGTLSGSDTLLWTASGRCTGSAGTRTVYWRAAVDIDDDGQDLDGGDDRSMSYTGVLPATCESWELTASLAVRSATRTVLTIRLSDLTNGTSVGAVSEYTSVAIGDHALRVGLSGRVANGSDTLLVSRIRRAALRPGFSI